MAEVTYTQKYNSDTHLEEVEIIYPKEDFDKNFDKAVDEVSKTATAKGFRKGNVPKNVVLANNYPQISDRSIEISVQDALKNIPPFEPKPMDVLNIQSVNPVGDDGKDGLKITLTYLPFPEIKLGDYSKIKVSKPEPKKASSEEVDKEVENVWHFYAKRIDPEVKKEDFDAKKIDKEFFEKSGMINENPDIDSYEKFRNFIETYINGTHIQENQLEWENNLKSEIVKASEYSHYEGLVERELERRVESYLARFKDIGMEPEEYLKKNNVNLEDLKKEWRPGAEEDLKFELVLQEYGRVNNIQPTEEEIESELAKLDAETRKMYNSDEDRLRSMITYYFVNSKSFKEIAELIDPSGTKAEAEKSTSSKTDKKPVSKKKQTSKKSK